MYRPYIPVYLCKHVHLSCVYIINLPTYLLTYLQNRSSPSYRLVVPLTEAGLSTSQFRVSLSHVKT